KTVDGFSDVHVAQMLTYLRLAKKRVGLLINFNTKSLKNGIKRVSL
ncbi:MAG: GxxExxY protein, partial [Algoriphagus sp. 32-45-6]